MLLIGAPARADVAIAPTPRSGATTATPMLFVDPVRVPSASALEIGGWVRVEGGPARAKKSVITVRRTDGDPGRVVFTDERAFMAREPYEKELDLGLGFSSSAGPSLPASLAPGEYAAVWTLDGVSSNTARFIIGPGAPPPLRLEPIETTIAGALAMLHVFNPGPRVLALPDEIAASKLFVDGRAYERQRIDWDGSSGLSPGHGYSFVVFAGDYGAKVTPGAHTLIVELGGRRSSSLARP
jgi:hypothetical protein